MLLKFFWLVVTARWNLHSFANGIFFTTFERINQTANLSNFWDLFGEASDWEYCGCYLVRLRTENTAVVIWWGFGLRTLRLLFGEASDWEYCGCYLVRLRTENTVVVIWWGFGLRILRLLFLSFLSVPRGSHWYHKAGPLPPSLIFFKIPQI